MESDAEPLLTTSPTASRSSRKQGIVACLASASALGCAAGCTAFASLATRSDLQELIRHAPARGHVPAANLLRPISMLRGNLLRSRPTGLLPKPSHESSEKEAQQRMLYWFPMLLETGALGMAIITVPQALRCGYDRCFKQDAIPNACTEQHLLGPYARPLVTAWVVSYQAQSASIALFAYRNSLASAGSGLPWELWLLWLSLGLLDFLGQASVRAVLVAPGRSGLKEPWCFAFPQAHAPLLSERLDTAKDWASTAVYASSGYTKLAALNAAFIVIPYSVMLCRGHLWKDLGHGIVPILFPEVKRPKANPGLLKIMCEPRLLCTKLTYILKGMTAPEKQYIAFLEDVPQAAILLGFVASSGQSSAFIKVALGLTVTKAILAGLAGTQAEPHFWGCLQPIHGESDAPRQPPEPHFWQLSVPAKTALSHDIPASRREALRELVRSQDEDGA
eukprot:TRINITY_DN11993_c0_g1_i10.p1 TRINITY_DN11993_c0_g1~~TRINITY_DN11993_c0_g1_i10.p1  ORF type:complete len:461 (+),score=70.70 TRINITY_DN11993_c0_g1_i10:39-1385(+)